MPNDTQSPYWLGFVAPNGTGVATWVHLQGIAPGWTRNVSRPSSEFVSVGGYRHIQVASHAMRDWELNMEYATPDALSALALAADWDGQVLLHDETAAVVNMLDARVTFGHESGSYMVVAEGLPMPCIGRGSLDQNLFTPGGVGVPVGDPIRLRVSQPYTVQGWVRSNVAAGEPVMDLIAGGVVQTTILAPAGTVDRAFSLNFVLDGTDGDTVVLQLRQTDVSALQMVEGATLSPTWMPGQLTPCAISVGDATREQVLTLRCGDGALSRDNWNFTLSEVAL